MSEEPHQAASAPLEGLRAPSSDGSLSLDHLSQAFQALLSGGSDPYAEPSTAAPLVNSDAAEAAQLAAVQQQVDPPEDDRQLTPRAILEAMLFVGLQDNAPLRPDGVAGLMRGVSADEIHDLVRELNEQYAANRCPYSIVAVGDGYRMQLRPEFGLLGDKVQGRLREARLSAASIEVLALIAYRGPQTSEQISRMRGIPSGHIVTHLVRRQLLKPQRDPENARKLRYQITNRFLKLYGLNSLDDLPRVQDPEPR